MTGDPIVDATTVAGFMAAVNTVYGRHYPVTVPPGTLAEMWAAAISVVKDPRLGVLYEATATATLPFGPGLSGTVVIDITTEGTAWQT